MKAASEGRMKGVLEYCQRPVVSSDSVGNPHSSIFDPAFSHQVSPDTVRLLSWYDNEWGYSNRVVDLLSRLSELS